MRVDEILQESEMQQDMVTFSEILRDSVKLARVGGIR